MSRHSDSPSASQYLSSSHHSLSNSKKASSEISKTYKHASELYLTRQLAEAHHALQSVIKPPRPDDDQRIKVWSLYAALLNAIVDLGPDQGKQEFGQKRYRDLVRLVQSGDVWEQVVNDGYRGREESVDAEVPTLDISAQLSQSLNGRRAHMNGTSTPKDLHSRIKIIELFTLHVLPAVGEWDYARSFVSNSDVLDEERREAFLQTLAELQEAKEQEDVVFEDDVQDYTHDGTHDGTHNGTHNGTHSPAADKEYTNGAARALHRTSTSRSHPSPPSRTPRRPGRRSSSKTQQQNTVVAQARHLFAALSNLTRNLAGSLTANPTALLSMLLFLLAFLLASSRREVRERLKLVLAKGWDKVRRTVGMGVKVSYI
ncbi:hypothetical protein DV737_g436, partial [Chaetothyriales sp. CBS 132003]